MKPSSSQIASRLRAVGWFYVAAVVAGLVLTPIHEAAHSVAHDPTEVPHVVVTWNDQEILGEPSTGGATMRLHGDAMLLSAATLGLSPRAWTGPLGHLEYGDEPTWMPQGQVVETAPLLTTLLAWTASMVWVLRGEGTLRMATFWALTMEFRYNILHAAKLGIPTEVYYVVVAFIAGGALGGIAVSAFSRTLPTHGIEA